MRAIFLVLVTAAWGHPAHDGLMVDVGGDTAVVESTVREARAAVPDHIEELLEPGVKAAFLHTHGDHENDDGDVQGYHKKSQDEGNDGYKHFDSYHKKDGDKYGYETHAEYGQENKAEADAAHEAQANAEGYEDDDHHGDEAETQKLYQVVENVNENKKGVSAVEDYDTGLYADSGSSYEAEAGGDGEGYDEGYEEGDGDAGLYVEDGDEGYIEYDDGESEASTEDDDY